MSARGFRRDDKTRGIVPDAGGDDVRESCAAAVPARERVQRFRSESNLDRLILALEFVPRGRADRAARENRMI